MPKLNARLLVLEQSQTDSGVRPAAMTDEQFVSHWTRMAPRQRQLFMRAMTDKDLDASITFLRKVIKPADNEEQRHHNTRTLLIGTGGKACKT